MKHIWIFALLALLVSACSPKQEIDRLIIGGVIHTGTEAQTLAQIIAIKDGRIVHVGTNKDTNKFTANEITDLNGAHLFPGFTDAHAHLFDIGQREVNLNLEGAKSLADMLAAVKKQVEANPQGVIIGQGWIETHWPESRFPNRFDLEAIAPGRSILLWRADGHALLASSPALDAMSIGPDSVDPEGGRIERDGEGAPSGILVDSAMELVYPLLSNPVGDQRKAYLAKGAAVMAAYGWTGLHNMSVIGDDVLQLETMAAADEMPIRIYNSIDVSAIDLLQDGPRFASDNRIITRAIKIFIDGALGSRGAALLAPYTDDPEQSGLMLTSIDQTLPLLHQAHTQGWQIAAHAIGDRGNREILNWMQQVFENQDTDQNQATDPRWRIEHAQMINPADIPKFAELSIIPSMQPSHAIGDLFFAPQRVGSDRLEGAYAWRSLIEAGSIIAGGSDAPVERGDLRIEFYAAVARASLDGFQDDDWHPQQAVSRQTALKMFTLWPAYASFQENDLGTVQVGKRADFTVFDRDLMTIAAKDILTAKVLWTIVDGKNAYKAKVETPTAPQ